MTNICHRAFRTSWSVWSHCFPFASPFSVKSVGLDCSEGPHMPFVGLSRPFPDDTKNNPRIRPAQTLSFSSFGCKAKFQTSPFGELFRTFWGQAEHVKNVLSCGVWRSSTFCLIFGAFLGVPLSRGIRAKSMLW